MSESNLENIKIEKISVIPKIHDNIEKSPLTKSDNSKYLEIICRYQTTLLLFNLFFLAVSGTILSYYTIQDKKLDNLFWLNQLSKYVVILVIQYGCYLLVKKYSVRINYTRKVVHISYFIWPQILDKFSNQYNKSIYTELWNIWIIVFLLVIMSRKIRENLSLLEKFFVPVDRPEDRPYTLIWFSSQIVVTLVILTPFAYYFNETDHSHLVFIPILINGLGDGLAEPIGIAFGRHKYKTKGCLSNREYTRSYEGSFCVYIVSLIIILFYYNYFYQYQFLFATLTIPITATFLEAYSPHTWDSPLIYLGVLSLIVITLQIPNKDF